MTLQPVSAGFIPLIDAAPLIVAQACGFAEAHGLDLQLKRSNSWAGLRDRLSVGDVVAAHMLPPIAIASQLGLGNPKAPMIVPCGLSMNGNAISVSSALKDAMIQEGWSTAQVRDPMASARSIAKVVRKRQAMGLPPLTFASVYPFSPHSYELRYWLAADGLNPDEDVLLTIVPPPQIAGALEEGHIDGFCVGAPWNSQSAQAGFSHIVATKVDMWRHGPEKVLAMREDWADATPHTVMALVRMLFDSAKWCAQESNTEQLAQILSGGEYLDLGPNLIAQTLRGRLPGVGPKPVEDHLLFDPHQASYPWHDHALWFYAQMVRWGQVQHSQINMLAAKKAYRPDIYNQSMGIDRHSQAVGDQPIKTGALPTSNDNRKADTTLFDQRLFDPDDVDGYLMNLTATPHQSG